MSAKVHEPAFPQAQLAGSDAPVDLAYCGGMTLRDYFAAAAATGAFRGGDTEVDDAIFARRCYQLADAMLAERVK